jgi:hypothetical protein
MTSQDILKALTEHARGEYAKHKANVSLLLESPVGLSSHTNYLDSVHDEIEQMSYWHDQIDTIEREFK